jgi:hypothetical protein
MTRKSSPDDDLDAIDREALEMSMAKAMEERAEQIAYKLKNESWREVAEFAAYACQCDSLHLKPWEAPPCSIFDEERDPEGARLLHRMLDAGISMYHPDPLKALKEADEREGRPSI